MCEAKESALRCSSSSLSTHRLVMRRRRTTGSADVRLLSAGVHSLVALATMHVRGLIVGS